MYRFTFLKIVKDKQRPGTENMCYHKLPLDKKSSRKRIRTFIIVKLAKSSRKRMHTTFTQTYSRKRIVRANVLSPVEHVIEE